MIDTTLLGIGRGFTAARDLPSYCVRLDGVKLVCRKGKTSYRTKGAAKVGIKSSTALGNFLLDAHRAGEIILPVPPNGYVWNTIDDEVDNIIDELINNGRLTIELE